MKTWSNFPVVATIVCATIPNIAMATIDATKPNVRYCGIGFAGKSDDKPKSYPALSKVLTGAAMEKANKDLRALTSDNASNINLVDTTEGASYGLSYVVTGENVESQPFIHPLNQQRQFNVIYSLKLQTVVFDINSKQIVSIYPAVIQYTEANDGPPNAAMVFVRYSELLKNATLEDSPIRAWAESSKEIGFNLDARSIAVAPVVLSEETRAALTKEAVGGAPDFGKIIRDLTADYEARLAVGLKKPVVPASIDSNGAVTPTDQYVVAIPGCLGQGDVAFKLPSAAYRFRFQVERLQSGVFEHKTPTSAGGASSVSQMEFAYGARYRVGLLAVDDSDSVNGGTTIDEQTLRFTSAKRFAGARELDPQQQYYKLTVGFMDALIKNMTSPDEKWIKEQLSAEAISAKVKPAIVKKTWADIYKNRLAINTASR